MDGVVGGVVVVRACVRPSVCLSDPPAARGVARSGRLALAGTPPPSPRGAAATAAPPSRHAHMYDGLCMIYIRRAAAWRRSPKAGWPLSEREVRRDVRRLLGGSYEDFLANR